MSEDLIPEEEPHNWFSGSGVLYDAQQLFSDTQHQTDAFDWTVDGVSAGLDVLITLADPFASAIAAGVGWILENVPVVRDQWNVISGNPEEIQRAAQTWSNIAQRLREQGGTFDQQAAVIEGWDGPAAASFRQTATDYSTIIGAVAGDAELLSVLVTGAGAVVAALREVCYWLISTWLVEEVIPEAIASLATSWCTFGASLAAFLTWLIISTSLTSAALAEKVGMAGVKVAEVYTKIMNLLVRLDAGEDALKFGIKALEGAGKAIDNPYVWAPRGGTRNVDNRHKSHEREGG